MTFPEQSSHSIVRPHDLFRKVCNFSGSCFSFLFEPDLFRKPPHTFRDHALGDGALHNRFPFIVFDVNETLLDLESLTPTFERIFGDRLALRRWFAELILYSEALTLAGIYFPFTDIGAAVLKMVATTCGISISAADRAELTEKFASMPAHPEVRDALLKLKRAGFPALHADQRYGRDFGATARASTCWMPSSVGSASMMSVVVKPAPEVYASVARGLANPAVNNLPGRLPHLGHAGCRRGGLGGCACPAAGQCTARRRTSAADDRRGPQGGRRQADRPLRRSRPRSVDLTAIGAALRVDGGEVKWPGGGPLILRQEKKMMPPSVCAQA